VSRGDVGACFGPVVGGIGCWDPFAHPFAVDACALVVIVVVRLTFDRAGTDVTCRTSLVRLRRSGVVVVSDMVVMDVVLCVELPVGALLSCEASASRMTNAARKFAMAFRIPSGNGPDRFSFQSSSICRSLESHCATVLSDMAGGCGCVAICCAVRAVSANML
jgi:hypothetical protein